MAEIIVRERQAADREGLLTALTACARATGYFADPEGELVAHAEESVFDERFDAAWVAELEGRIVGHVALMPLTLSEDIDCIPIWAEATGYPAEKHTLVKRLFVDPGAQRGGIAKALMAVAMERIEQRDQLGVLDTASIAEPAMTLYHRLGWREIARTKPHWTDDPFDMVLFVGPGL
ncbi:GNAT superfamily N-acetyltransferase [Psychromicrobium silvestre]|uniref:GNAT superfamily N-acetyltransferase n=1 Tax=Psychromicrobium silvestre TaxID=1645614 RepID=A0A7Y9S8F5_9MICC|nr:GNAT family N-acetyltransferase [Psychromicrobium silvestre]NYE95302.1 GNAT superfamily N-acetyltransferase [Psychromicrobium silvestre]